jgi:HD-GYP domain-containing protein (c-di-GMP phosphodiesterase class II)
LDGKTDALVNMIDESDRSIPMEEDNILTSCALSGKPRFGKGEGTAGFFGEGGSFALVPLTNMGSLVGLLAAVSRQDGFTEKITEDLAALAEPIALGCLIARDYESFQRYRERSLELISRAVDSVTPEGEGHSLRVAGITSIMASRLDVSGSGRRTLWNAALYHDIGKLLLTGREPWEVEELHGKKAGAFLGTVDDLSEAADLIEHHHERYDGTGFPGKLAGDDLPLETWILAVAEDLDEYCCGEKSGSIGEKTARFLAQKGASHHPQVLESLAASVEAEEIQRLYL